MRLQAWTHQDFFALGKAIFRHVTGVVYPFASRTSQRAVLMVQSIFAASASIETIRAVKVAGLENLKGILLERKVLESETVRGKPKAARVLGKFRPIGGSWATDISIPGGTVFMRRATATQSEIAFRTEAAALIPATAAESNQVYGVAIETGTRSNGIPSGTPLYLRNPISGVADFYTDSDSSGGLSRELDPKLRERAREKRRGHGEATWLGIENLLKSVEITGGNRVTHCKVFEAFEGANSVIAPPSIVGVTFAIIDDGTGLAASIGELDTTTYQVGAGTWWEFTSDGNYLYIDLPQHALEVWDDGVTGEMERDDGAGYVAKTYETDYWVDVDRGQIVLLTPLTVGQSVRFRFQFYDKLIEECAKRLTGVRGDPTLRGWRPLGYSIRVRAPYSVSNPDISATLAFKPGWDSEFGRSVATTAVIDYLNGLDIGEPARYNKLASITHKAPGLDTVSDLLIDGGTADVAPTHAYGVIRGGGTISL